MRFPLLRHTLSFLRTARSSGLREAVAEKIRHAGRRSGLAGPEERAALGAETAALRAELRTLRESVAALGSRIALQAQSLQWLARNHAAPAPAAADTSRAPLVSIVLPVWNRERRIREAIASVRAQTFENWELVVVDDGSTDGTRAAVAECLGDPRIRLVTAEHRGAAAARNRGLTASGGEIIAYLDSDDVWFPGFLASVAAAFAAHPDRDAAYGALLISHPDPAQTYLRGAPFDRDRLLEGNFIPMTAFAHRRALFERLGGFDESLSRLIDWDLILRYTADGSPVELPVIAGEYRFGPWSRITNEESLGFNTWRIHRKHPPRLWRKPRVLYALEYEPTLSESYVQAELACMRRWGVAIELWAERDGPAPFDTGLRLHRGELGDAIARVRPDVVHVHHLYRALRYLPDTAAAGVPMTVRGHGFEFVPERARELLSSPSVDRLYVFPHHRQLFGDEESKLRPMPVAFDPDRYAPAAKKDPRFVVRASLAAPAKGLAAFVRLAARHRSHRFVLFACSSTGHPEHLAEIRELNRSLGEPVDLRSDRPYEEVQAVVAEAAIYLHTTTLEEPYGMPISIAEAMATGSFVLARRSAEAADYVGDAGALYGDDDEASAVLRETASWTEERWAAVRRRSVDRAYARFVSDTVLRPLLSDWVRLANGAKPRVDLGDRRLWVAGDASTPSGGLQVIDVADGVASVDEASGVACMAFRNPDGAAQGYFRLARPHAFTGRAVDIEVEVLADVDDAIRLEYDSSDPTVRVVPSIPGAFKQTASKALARSGAWRAVEFSVDDGRFTPSLNGADFRVVSSRALGWPLRVRRVAVSCRGNGEALALPAPARPLRFEETREPTVSIIVPTWNHAALVRACLEAIAARTPPGYEMIVVDDGSSDGTARELARVPGLRLVALPSNHGFSKACNAGAREARANRLLFLNDDTVPLGGWLEPMLAALDRDPFVGVVGSRLLYPGVGVIQHAGIEMSETGPRHRLQSLPADAAEADVDCFVPAVTGACLLVRRRLFDELGGFDEAFANGCEDVDFCLRVAERGFRVLYCGSSMLLHHECATRGADDSERERANLALLMRRWRGRMAASRVTADRKPGVLLL